MADLLLNEISFPSGEWRQLGSPSPRGAPSSVSVERLGTSFLASQREVAVNDVYRFFDEVDAERSYDDLSETWFRNHPDETAWFVPDEISNAPVADEYRLACNKDTVLDVQQCRFIARYDAFVTDLSVRTVASKYDEFATLVSDVDGRFNSCLSRER